MSKRLVSRVPLPVRSQQAYALSAGSTPAVDTALPVFTPKPSGSAVCPDAAASSLSLFHVKSFLNRVSPRYHDKQAFPLFTSKASWTASHPDIETNMLFLFSRQKLPGPRLTPISRPTSFLFFHLPSFQNAFLPRFHDQKDQDQKQAIRTTGLAGGLFCPYKGLLPACARKAHRGLPIAPHSQPPLKGLVACFLIPAVPLRGLQVCFVFPLALKSLFTCVSSPAHP